jgi:hypothetical protein
VTEGIDYAWDRPNLDVLWNSGKRFVCRYLAYLPNGKALSASERAALHAKGFSIVLNWEQSSGDMFKGYSTGQAHAREALRQANALGAPASVPIYFSCDKDVTTDSEMYAVAAYLDGAASVLGRGRVGVYGEYSVIEAMLPGPKPAGLAGIGDHAAWGWQTYAWSGGKNSTKAHFKQYKNGVTLAGADCDLNVSLKPNFGAWFPGVTPAATDTAEAEDMNLSDTVNLPVSAYPEGGASASVETVLGYMNGRIIRLEAMITALTAKPAATVTVDPAALTAALQEPAFLAALAKAVNDDNSRRMAQ